MMEFTDDRLPEMLLQEHKFPYSVTTVKHLSTVQLRQHPETAGVSVFKADPCRIALNVLGFELKYH